MPRMISTRGIRGTGYMKCMHGSPALHWKMLMAAFKECVAVEAASLSDWYQ